MVRQRGAMVDLARSVALATYYGIAWRLPTQPMPGWRFAYWWRRRLVNRIVDHCGVGVVVKQKCYLGDGSGVWVGDNAQLGHGARIDQDVRIGHDVVMGPDVVIMTNTHAFEEPNRPIRLQGNGGVLPVVIEDDVWIGTRVIVLPGVTIGRGSVVGAGSVVTRSIPAFSIAVGVPAQVVRRRGERL